MKFDEGDVYVAKESRLVQRPQVVRHSKGPVLSQELFSRGQFLQSDVAESQRSSGAESLVSCQLIVNLAQESLDYF